MDKKKRQGVLGFLGLGELGKGEWILIGLFMILTFVLVYSPHFGYKWPLHVDEWHHITEARTIKDGNFVLGRYNVEIGFHVFLMLLSYFVNLVGFYQFLPALWAVISGLVLFWVVYRKTEEFFIALFAMIFFASIKSNINLLGMWFFTPLTFAIPFIFLYVYFFTEGIEQKNSRLILASLGIMIFLVFVHAISVLFAIPFLLIYGAFNWKVLLEKWKIFGLFVLLPIIGFLFYNYLMNLGFGAALGKLGEEIRFSYGWGVSEYDNSFLEVYSFVGYILAAFGASSLFLLRKDAKRYLAYILWPLCLLVMIIIFRFFGVSYLSPYQRNMYYFAISLPLLSAFGLKHLVTIAGFLGGKIRGRFREVIKNVVIVIVVLGSLSLAFLSYFDVPSQFTLYNLMDDEGYKALTFLEGLGPGKVMAPGSISTAMYPISGHEPIGTLYFYGNSSVVSEFFAAEGCENKTQIVNENNVSYVLSDEKIECNWTKLYGKGNYSMYRV